MSHIIIKRRGMQFKIERDPHQFILTKFRKSKKPEEEDSWDLVGYYSDLYYLFKKLISLDLIGNRTKEDSALEELVHKTCKELKEITIGVISRESN